MVNKIIIEEKQSIAQYRTMVSEEDLIQEWSPPVYLNDKGILVSNEWDFLFVSNNDLSIENDSIYWMDFPTEMKQKSSLELEGNKLLLNGIFKSHTCDINSTRDTLTLSYMDQYGLFIEETYLRVSFDDSLKNILKKYTLNLSRIAGKWEIFREGNMSDDGSEYTLNFPYKIPDFIELTANDLNKVMMEDAPILMSTDGKKRPYYLSNNYDWFFLTPDDWFPKNEASSSVIYILPLKKEAQYKSVESCFNEFLICLRSGNIGNTVDLMTMQGSKDLRENIPPIDMRLAFKQKGLLWQNWEMNWTEKSATKAKGEFGPKEHQIHVEFIREDGLWYIDKMNGV